MPLDDMIDDLYHQVQQEMDELKDRTRIESTKSLIAQGDELEKVYADKKQILENNLRKKEETLRAEKDFALHTELLNEENEFSEFLGQELEKHLLEFTQSSQMKYQSILKSWYQQVLEAIDSKEIIFYIAPQDQEFFTTIIQEKTSASLIVKDSIKAGFIAQSPQGVKIDLSFRTLFNEQKYQLLRNAMRTLKGE